MMKKCLITGICGQTGSYMAELLIEKGYKVYGVYRRSSTPNFWRIGAILDNPQLQLIEGDICDASFLSRTIKDIQPDEIYNFAAQSHVGTSFQQPIYTWEATAMSVLNLLEAVRTESPHSRVYQASSSEMFGSSYSIEFDKNLAINKYQDENTIFTPQSPYAIAKLAAHHLIRNYRDSYNIYGCSSIAFNHESPRRGENFVTRKITKWIGNHLKSPFKYPTLHLGNLSACRDWSHARDVAVAAWLMLQQDSPDDYVVASGETHSVEEFLDISLNMAGLKREGLVQIDSSLFRPSEVDYLKGHPVKAKDKLQWSPKYNFNSLVKEMVNSDIYS